MARKNLLLAIIKDIDRASKMAAREAARAEREHERLLRSEERELKALIKAQEAANRALIISELKEGKYAYQKRVESREKLKDEYVRKQFK